MKLERIMNHMDDKERDKREQDSLRKIQKFHICTRNIVVNAVIIALCVVSAFSIVRYLRMDNRSLHDNQQLVISFGMFVTLLLLGGLNNFWGKKILKKFLQSVNGRQERSNIKNAWHINDLKSALYKLSHRQGTIIWDTLWGCMLVFMLAVFIVFYKTCNRAVVLGIIVFLAIMLFSGHLIAAAISRNKHFDKRLCKYTGRYIALSDEETFIGSVDQSIRQGVLAFTGYWLLTNDFMIGRLSDVSYEPVAIPRNEIVKCTFFFEKVVMARGLPVGVLRLQLNNGKVVDFILGRGNACDQTLRVLNEQQIPWSRAETRYTPV